MSNFPISLPASKENYDSSTDVASEYQNQQGSDINAIAAKVGIDGSTNPDSLENRVSALSINVKLYGAKGDGVTDDTAAIQAAIDATGHTGGEIYFPSGTYVCASALDVTNTSGNIRVSLKLKGNGGVSGGAATKTMLSYTGSADARFIDARGSAGLTIEDMMIFYTNVSFTGKLIGLEGGVGLSDSAYGLIRRCFIGGNGVGIDNASALISLNRGIIHLIDQCVFGKAVVAIKGKDGLTDYSNKMEIRNCTFTGTTTPLSNSGDTWNIIGATFETSTGIIYRNDAGMSSVGLNFFGCWGGDVTEAGVTGIEFLGDNLNVENCNLNSDGSATLIEVRGNLCNGIKIEGNRFGYAGKAVDFGVTTGHTNVSIKSNSYSLVTTEVAGTIPSGAFVEYDGRTGVGTLPSTIAADTFKFKNGTNLTFGDGADADGLLMGIDSASNVAHIFQGNNSLLNIYGNGKGVNVQLNGPEGFLVNGKIVPSVASNNLTVAIKGMDGNDPSATNPVYCRIGDTVRSITTALYRNIAHGTNWFNMGSAELATKEVDLFVYLIWNTALGAPMVTYSRIPYAHIFSDFHAATGVSENDCYLDSTGLVAGDTCELIGRFAATLSATANFYWSVPTFTTSNLIQRPIYETRVLDYVLQISAATPPNPAVKPGKYQLNMNKVTLTTADFSFGTSVGSGAYGFSLPFAYVGTVNYAFIDIKFALLDTSDTYKLYMGYVNVRASNSVIQALFNQTTTNFSNTVPITVATDDEITMFGSYTI